MNLTVVLVNYKCDKRKLQLCLNSIKIDTNIIIIDHSHDFTFDDLTVPNNLNIKIIKNVNLGNGAGINCGLKNANTRFVLYLDIDTILSNLLSFDKHLSTFDKFVKLLSKINQNDNILSTFDKSLRKH